MPYEVTLKDTQTGEVRSFIENLVWEEHSDFLWSADGSFGCDCNRGLFFARASGDPDPDDLPCGDARFVILGIIENGVEVYSSEE